MKSIAFIALIAGVQSVRVAREPLLSWAPTEPASAFKKNYFVPHFGEDREITHSKNSIVVAENQLGHKWNIKDEDDPPKRNYFVPNFGEDTDITAAKKHIAQQEKIHGVWQVQQDDNGNYIVPEAADNNSYSYKA